MEEVPEVIDVIDDESECPEVRKRSSESEENHSPSKLFKYSESTTQLSSAEDFGSTSFTCNIEYSIPQSSSNGVATFLTQSSPYSSRTSNITATAVPEDDVEFVAEIYNKTSALENDFSWKNLSEKTQSRSEKDHEKSFIFQQSPNIFETSELSDDTDSNNTIILKQNGTLTDDEEDTYELLGLSNDIVKNVTKLRSNSEILLHDENNYRTQLSGERNRIDDFNCEQDSSFCNGTEQTNLNINSRPVIVDLEDETDIEEEFPMDKPDKIAEPLPVLKELLKSLPVIDINSDTSEDTALDNYLNELEVLSHFEESFKNTMQLDSKDSSTENGCVDALSWSTITGEDGFDSESTTNFEELPLDEPETVIVNGFPDSTGRFTNSKKVFKSLKDPLAVSKESPHHVKNRFVMKTDRKTRADLKLSQPDTTESHIIKSSVENLKTEKRKVKLKDVNVTADEFNAKPSKSITRYSENETREIEETYTPISNEKIFTSETKYDEVMSQILEWNLVEFQIHASKKKCPVLKNYKTYGEYCEVLISHLLFDVARKIKKGLATIDKHSRFENCDVIKNSASKIQIAGVNSCMLTFYLYLKVSIASLYKVPAFGDLVRLKISGKRHKQASLVLGYVQKVTTIDVENNFTQLICTVTTKFLDLNIYTSTVLDLHVITSLLTSLNMVEAMSDFKSSPLFPLILNPGIEDFPPHDLSEPIVLSPSSCIKPQVFYVASNQAHAIMGISRVIQNQKPKICILEGPPGTGKTTVLIDIISNVLCKKEKNDPQPKILVCAKSVDEIVSRLASVKKLLDQGRDIKLVRIGDPDTTNPEVKKVTSEVLAKRHIDLGIREFLLAEEIDLQDKQEYQEKLSSLNSDYNELEFSCSSIRSHILETCFEILKSGKTVREMSEEDNSKLMNLVESMILSEANVIACTLSIHLANKLDSIYGKKKKISVCIIDEATQIPEIEILKPLTYGVQTLVLIGDPFLPSLGEMFGNHLVKRRKLNNSLFSRIKANYSEMHSSPTFTLNCQFRIHPNVVYWLNKFIYGTKMSSGFARGSYPLLPYKVLNLSPYDTNRDEPLFVATLISCIVQFAKVNEVKTPISIGVILPMAASKVGVISAINTSLSSLDTKQTEKFTIDVDTIAGFRNQERDVIIISCTKKIKNMKKYVEDDWLYTSITKVKQSLMLYGAFGKKMKPSLLTSLVRVAGRGNTYFNIHDSLCPSELKAYIIRKS